MKTLLLSFFILFNASAFAGSLIGAVKKGDLELVRTMLEAGANPNTKSFLGYYTIQIAAENADPDMLALLLEFKADPNKGLGYFISVSPIGLATQSNCLKCVKLLVEAGATVTPGHLEYAHDKGRWDIARYLYDRNKA